LPDKLITEIPLIRRYSRHNEDADWKFRSYLKLNLNMSDNDLDILVTEETDRVWKQIDCLNCGNCCKTLQVIVDKQDIERLSKRLNISPKEFNRLYVKVDQTDKQTYLGSSPCQFLGSDNKCSVYEDRPQSCRDFPYLHASKFRSRSLMMLENLGTCPIVFNVWQSLKSKLWKKPRVRAPKL
jgi:Fe-S-cluster containining protein